MRRQKIIVVDQTATIGGVQVLQGTSERLSDGRWRATSGDIVRMASTVEAAAEAVVIEAARQRRERLEAAARVEL